MTTLIAAEAQIAGFAAPSSPQPDRAVQALRRERKDGLKLAFRLRAAVLLLVLGYLLSLGLDWEQLVNAGVIACMCLSGWLQYRIVETRFDRPLVMGLFPVADVMLVAYAVFAGFEWQGLPRIIMDEERPVTWFLLPLAMQSLANRPWLAAWAGVVTAVAWIGIMFWLLSYPGAHGRIRFEDAPAGTDPAQRLLEAAYDPFFVNTEVWIREAFIAILCGAILAVAVYRAQGMMARAVQAERSRANLSRYFSPSMIDQLSANDQPLQGAREQRVGVLFADIVGFTRIAEACTPGELIALLREFHGNVANVVFAHQGTLDKFIGDCVMATFGTPEPRPGDATRTVACCRAIGAAVEAWNAERQARGLPAVRIGIGAHYGPVVVGDIGDERRLEFAVLGDTVNVASRLEGLTRQLGCTILVSDDLVRAACREDDAAASTLTDFERVEPQHLRNRDETVLAWAWGSQSSAPSRAGEHRSAGDQITFLP